MPKYLVNLNPDKKGPWLENVRIVIAADDDDVERKIRATGYEGAFCISDIRDGEYDESKIEKIE